MLLFYKTFIGLGEYNSSTSYIESQSVSKIILKTTYFRVGADSDIKYLVLQVHYGHIDHIPNSGDDSGVFLEYTETEQPKTAGVLLMGTGGFALPHSTTYFETSCEMEDPRTMHPFAFRTHTHSLGRESHKFIIHTFVNSCVLYTHTVYINSHC